MPTVLISFLDGEVLYAETPEITFDLPVLEAEVRSIDPNNERALFPVSAIRQIIVGDVEAAPEAAEVAEWDRAAFHFADGQVLRASISPEVSLGRHGGVWRIVEQGSDELRTLAIPYTALKGVFQVRQWDSRPVSERSGESDAVAQLTRVLAERESSSGAVTPIPARRPLLSRIRRQHRE